MRVVISRSKEHRWGLNTSFWVVRQHIVDKAVAVITVDQSAAKEPSPVVFAARGTNIAGGTNPMIETRNLGIVLTFRDCKWGEHSASLLLASSV